MRVLQGASDLNILWAILFALGGLIIGALVVFFIPFFKNKNAEKKAEKIVEQHVIGGKVVEEYLIEKFKK